MRSRRDTSPATGASGRRKTTPIAGGDPHQRRRARGRVRGLRGEGIEQIGSDLHAQGSESSTSGPAKPCTPVRFRSPPPTNRPWSRAVHRALSHCARRDTIPRPSRGRKCRPRGFVAACVVRQWSELRTWFWCHSPGGMGRVASTVARAASAPDYSSARRLRLPSDSSHRGANCANQAWVTSASGFGSSE